ncbi:hypothetical protein CROQUDRAFT_657090 [Cronartium quercuum f. sp. fusiforme G11]|uniref:Conserved oligomeric Golgi complex subunit 5 n=1 Tax=Cronartium quercuum f. sp. fusiforme G11 TaxID=708437 RepID=A0A9P6NIH5_9BASI|nr:hypothetical protein CROQUDRAFT_657090 [Cronartium quercuum f. sp. fusiforme G11]
MADLKSNTNHNKLFINSTDYQEFLDPNFEPKTFANTILSKESNTDSPQHLTTALNKLNISIEDINKQIRSDILIHHLELLTKSTSIHKLDHSLQLIKNGLKQIEINVERLQNKIGNKFQILDESINKLERFQITAELCRKVSRFINLCKRLHNQMKEFQIDNNKLDQNEMLLVELAITISDLESLLTNNIESIKSLKVINIHINSIHSAKQKVITEMNKMLELGLINLDRSLIATSVQTAFNLSILPQTVTKSIEELSDVIKNKVRSTFDITSIAKQVAAQDPTPTKSFVYKSRSRTEPTTTNIQQWNKILWNNLESLIDDLTFCCSKIYTLEKVLKHKKDLISGQTFLDLILSNQDLDEPPRNIFWTTLRNALEKESSEASRGSNFINQTLTQSYPRLLRSFHEFFSRISIHTGTTYTITTQSPETLLTLKSISPFEIGYLDRCVQRLIESINNSKPEKIRALLGNELDAARFDPLLLRSVTKKLDEVLSNHIDKIEDRIVRDYQATSISGPVITNSQATNLDLATMLSYHSLFFSHVINEYPKEISKIIEPINERINILKFSILSPIIISIKKEVSTIILKMHLANNQGYMNELVNKLSFIKLEILSKFPYNDKFESIEQIGNFIIDNFLLNLSLRKPLNETTKLKLTSEITELEFNLTQFLNLEIISSLKQFRQLLFSEQINNDEGMNKLVLIHHLLIKYDVQLIHERLNWTENEYLKWLNEHPNWLQQSKLINEVINEKEEEGDWVKIVKTILNEDDQE